MYWHFLNNPRKTSLLALCNKIVHKSAIVATGRIGTTGRIGNTGETLDSLDGLPPSLVEVARVVRRPSQFSDWVRALFEQKSLAIMSFIKSNVLFSRFSVFLLCICNLRRSWLKVLSKFVGK